MLGSNYSLARGLGILTLSVALLGATSAVGAGLGNSDAATPGKVKQQARSAVAIKRALADTGTARVIVGLESASEPMAVMTDKSLPDAADAGQRRAAIGRLQERVLAKLVNPGSVKRYKNFSYMALEVDARELADLEAASEVVAIFDDQTWDSTLDTSAPQIGADAAWAGGYTGAGQTIAIIDSGVDSSHPGLAGKVVAEACFSTNSSRSTSLCPNGSDSDEGPGAGRPCSGVSGCDHGTHVAGIAAGNSDTYTGVAPDANLIAIQVFSEFDASSCGGSSSCKLVYFSDVLRAMDWLYDQRSRFAIASVNLSLGGGKYQSAAECDSAYQPLAAASARLRGTGITTVAASGNNGFTSAMLMPACISGVVSVGSVGGTDAVANYSNSASWLTLLAPGQSIKSTVFGGAYANKNGTSMAAPHVAGAFALLRSADNTASVDTLVAALQDSGKPVTDSRNGITVPRVQVAAAIQLLAGTGSGPIVEPPPPPEPEQPAPAVVTLTPNVLDSGQYGYGYGSAAHESEVVASFQRGSGDFEFSVSGYDIDQANEASVLLNGELLGYLTLGPDAGLNAGDTFRIPHSQQWSGANEIVIRQRSPGWVWGVTNLLLSDLNISGSISGSSVELIPGELDTGEYGHNFGSNLNKAELVASFTANDEDLTLSVAGYDIDFDDEVSVVLNGELLGYLSKGRNKGLNDGDSFSIPGAKQAAGENQIEFRQRNPGWIWGVTSLKLSATGGGTPDPDPEVEVEVEVAAGEVLLSPGVLDDGAYGYRFGSDQHIDELVVKFAGGAGEDYVIRATGYDVDKANEVSVRLNGELLGYLPVGPNNALSAPAGFTISASAQKSGANEIVFAPRVRRMVWGVTELLLQ